MIHTEYWPRDPETGLPYLLGKPECPVWIVRLFKIELNKIMGYTATNAEYTTQSIKKAFTQYGKMTCVRVVCNLR